MSVTRILVEHGLLETRAAAFAYDTPVALFLDSPLLKTGPRRGSIHPAILRDRPDGLDGGFCALETTGEDVFVRFPARGAPPLGHRLTVRIEAEARPGKSARAHLVDDATPSLTALGAWTTSLVGKDVPETEHADSPEAQIELDAAVEAALVPRVQITRGGGLSIHPTPALTAIDIDSAGRLSRGRPAQAARALNLSAAEAAAEALALRGLGGLVVIDCVAPIPKPVGTEIKAAFLGRFRAISGRKVQALAPSPFGLMEVSIAWREAPIATLLLDQHGALTPAAAALAGLRRLEREANTDRASHLVLELPKTAYMALMDGAPDITARLQAKYGARLNIRESAKDQIEVFRP